MAVTSLAVSRLQVAFWGNPSHKAGARGAVLVSIHGGLEGRSARQVCFLRHRLTPGLCSGTDGVPSGHVDPTMSPTSPGGQGTESLPFPYTRISAVVRRARPCQPSTAARVADAAAPCGRACRGTSVPAVATRTGRFLYPSLAFPAALGTGQMAAHGPAAVPARLPEASALCSSRTVTQPGNQRRGTGGGKPSWPSLLKAEVLRFFFLTKQLLLG